MGMLVIWIAFAQEFFGNDVGVERRHGAAVAWGAALRAGRPVLPGLLLRGRGSRPAVLGRDPKRDRSRGGPRWKRAAAATGAQAGLATIR